MTQRVFKTKGAAKAALKREGIARMAHTFIHTPNGYTPHVYCLNAGDREECRRRGFSAEVNVEFANKE